MTTAIAHAEEVYLLKRLLISDTESKAAALDPAKIGDGRVVVKDVPLLESPEFEKVVSKYFGHPISTPLLNGLIKDIGAYARAHDRLIAKVLIPNQNVTAGALRLGVVIGRYNQLEFVGNHYFSRALLEQKLGIKPGDEIRLSTLEDAVLWLNTNPFRRIKVLVNDLQNSPGKADLLVGVQEQRPFRVAASYDDSGNAIIGRNHYTASVQFGNVWGLDHLASYQFVTTDKMHLYQAHSIDYRIPLRWRHFLQFTAAYVQSSPSLAGGLFEQKGETVLANLRYTVPVRTGENPVELYAAVDFKETNNNLEFGGQNVLSSKTDTFQANFGGSFVHHDRLGAWLLATSLNISPGGVNSRNTTENFDKARAGASARYIYGTAAIQRLINLPHGWSLFSRVSAQLASTNLLPNEQLAIGGVNTVRGFNPNVFDGDEGYVFGNDLQSPAWQKRLSFIGKKSPPLETRFVLFYDAAQVFFKHHLPVLGQPGKWDDDPLRPIASAGVGIRENLATNFSLSFDYGWQVTHPQPPANDHGRGAIKVVLAF